MLTIIYLPCALTPTIKRENRKVKNLLPDVERKQDKRLAMLE